ncbi:MAG: protocatechuate 3,4-dioxygenase subunit alpha [Pseudomonadota bacterium]
MTHTQKKSLPESPSQTAGPYLHIGCTPNAVGLDGVYAVDPGSGSIETVSSSESIVLSGCVFDGQGERVRDCMVEIWQADAAGRYCDNEQSMPESFGAWRRSMVDFETGEFCFTTIKPGSVAYDREQQQAPHISLWLVARGINVGLHTRVYFDDEPEANASDPILVLIEPRERVATLLARKMTEREYRFEIHLQGDRETVFFDA